MGLLDRFRSRQERASYDRSAGDMLVNESQFMWTGHDSGGGVYPIGPHGPFAVECLPAITRLTAIITDPLTASPWTVAESTTGMPIAGAAVPPPRWMTDPQLLRPDDRYPVQPLPAVRRTARSTFWAEWLRSAVWFGVGYLWFTEDAQGSPMPGTLRVLHPWMVRPVRNDAGQLVWEIGDERTHESQKVRTDYDGRTALGGQRQRLVALRDPHAVVDADGRPVGMFERNRGTFRLAGTIENYTAGVYHSGIPSGYLKVNAPDLDADRADDIKKRWLGSHGGDRRSIAVLNATTEFHPIQFTPHDAALMEGKKANLADMSLAFALDPAGSLGVSMGGSFTYNNAQQQFARLRQDLLPWITGVEQTIGALLPAGRDMRIDFSELTRPDPTQQFAVLNTAVASEILTKDEARAQVGLPPLGTQQEANPDADS